MTKCYFCGEVDVLEEHHIVPRRYNGSDKEDNIVTVCPTCHRKLEKLYDDKFYRKVSKNMSAGADKDLMKELGEESIIYECHRCGLEFHTEDLILNGLKVCPDCGSHSYEEKAELPKDTAPKRMMVSKALDYKS